MFSTVQVDIKTRMMEELNGMAGEVQQKTIEALAEIYGFDAKEAEKKIGLEMKERKKMPNKAKTNIPSVPLPWCGEVNTEWCCGIRPNGGLQSQCTNPKVDGGKFCKTCKKQCEKEGNNGKPNYGEVSDRMAAGNDYEVNGKKPVKYSQVMAKKGISREEAEREAAKLGWTIPESEFEEVVKVSKKKKTTTVSDTESDSESETEKPKKRGRPAKKKTVKDQDEQLSKIVDDVEAKNSSSESESENEKSKKKTKKSKKQKKEKKELTDEEKAAKKAETKRKKQETREKNKAKKAEEEAKAKKAEEEAKAKKAEEEAKAKKAEEDAKLEKQIDAEIAELEVSEDEGEEETKECETVVTSKDKTMVKEIGGKQYIMEKDDEEQCLYDKETGECVGTYDAKTNTVKPLEDLDSDSDSDSD